jgi:hypothetical protein
MIEAMKLAFADTYRLRGRSAGDAGDGLRADARRRLSRRAREAIDMKRAQADAAGTPPQAAGPFI